MEAGHRLPGLGEEVGIDGNVQGWWTFEGASGVAWPIKFTLWINDLQMIYKQVSAFESSFLMAY